MFIQSNRTKLNKKLKFAKNFNLTEPKIKSNRIVSFDFVQIGYSVFYYFAHS